MKGEYDAASWDYSGYVGGLRRKAHSLIKMLVYLTLAFAAARREEKHAPFASFSTFSLSSKACLFCR